MTVEELLFFFPGAKRQGTGWITLCPAHDDRKPSLKIDRGSDGRALLHCFALCTYESIMEKIRSAAGRNEVASWTVPTPLKSTDNDTPEAAATGAVKAVAQNTGPWAEVAQYDYVNPSGRFLFQVLRLERMAPDGTVEKKFPQRRKMRAGESASRDGWVYNLDGIPRVLYNVRALPEAELVYVVEGEKDVESLRNLGLTATCNPGGAGKWRPEYNEHLAGKTVVIVPDNDGSGRLHSEQVAASLIGIAKEVLVIQLPGLLPKGDVTDFILAGGTDDDLMGFVQRAEPWQRTNLSAASATAEEDSPIEMSVEPQPKLPDAALYGLAGEIVRAIAPHTEADPAALLFQLLAAFGCLVGRRAWYMVEATRHYPKLFITLVGASSKARKGTSWSHIDGLLTRVEPSFLDMVHDGLSSGEGLIFHVRDPETLQQPIKGRGRVGSKNVRQDEGAKEKRLFVQEPEFARVLTVLSREGNTLSAVIRQAWDSDRLRTMTKTPLKATDAHVSIASHITLEELRRTLEVTETSNGFANRFLWVFVRRSCLLPFGGSLKDAELNSFVEAVRAAYEECKDVGEISMDGDARDLWCEVYPELSEARPGLFGSVTSRSEAQVIRLALIYALLDRSADIRTEHLRAALAAWEYCSDSARFIFGQRTGDKVADKILSALRDSDIGLTRTHIRDLFGRNKDAAGIEAAVRVLAEMGLIEIGKLATEGRSAEVIKLRRYD